MRRGVAVVLAVMIAVSLTAPIVAAQSNETATETATATPPASDWSPPGPFERGALMTGGVHDSEAPTSVRNIGDPISGSVGVRTSPPTPLQSDKSWAEPGSTIESDRIQLYGTAYADAVGEYELVVVYWNDRQTTANGTQVEYAANQSVQRVSFNMTAGYNKIPIKLRSNYDEKTEVTMWLERGGERVDGVRWRYQHRSNPLTAAPTNSINSKGDLWRWGALNILLPAVPGIFVGRKAAVHFLERTVTSPRKGTTWWLLLIGVLSLALVAGATWQTAAVLSQAPFVAGLSIAVLSFVAILGVRDQDVERAEFNRKDLESVTSVTGDETKNARDEDIQIRDIIRRDGEVFMPAKGIRPFLARYWADPASVDESDLKTVNNTSGDVSKKYEIDPGSDKTLYHKPARLSFSPTIVEPMDDDAEPPESAADKILSPLQRINWSFVGPAVLGGFVAYFGMQAWLGVPSVSALVAVLPALVAGYVAEDGELDFEPAPYHFSKSRAILVSEREQYKQADTFDKLHERMAETDMDSQEQALDYAQAYMHRAKTEMDQVLGAGQDSVVAAEEEQPRGEQNADD